MTFPLSELGPPLYFNLLIFAAAMLGVYYLIKTRKKR